MSNVTNEQCDTRVGQLHEKLDQIIKSQGQQNERLAVIETKLAGNTSVLGHIVTVVIAAITAFVTNTITKWTH